ncbi:hypothetical protein E2562_013698 [Oryza meyeriana var. granulata]|uniref:Uncharacterized protein n=1 Tax=Oryza meyeriana var. granulata TaxID=110450 RepID=A0A6G1BJM6_9ORYZ|nr:hypothetical protein E2562_013698 [Oryza meyeriana var. granulata]
MVGTAALDGSPAAAGSCRRDSGDGDLMRASVPVAPDALCDGAHRRWRRRRSDRAKALLAATCCRRVDRKLAINGQQSTTYRALN